MIIGSVLLGAKGVVAKILYARGLDFETVVSLRAVLAIPGFFAIAVWQGGLAPLRHVSRAAWLQATLAGVICYAIGASANFFALTLIDASVERALLFSYPAMVVMVGWIASKRRPRALTLVAVVATWLGIALTVGAFRQSLLAQNIVGAGWVLFCSATIAYYFMVSAKLTREMGSAQFTLVAMTAAGVALAVSYGVRSGWAEIDMDAETWAWFLGLVVFVTVLPLYLIAEGVRRIGAQRGAIASTVGPPSAALLAIAFLGEVVTAGQLAGIALIVGGILALELRRRA